MELERQAITVTVLKLHVAFIGQIGKLFGNTIFSEFVCRSWRCRWGRGTGYREGGIYETENVRPGFLYTSYIVIVHQTIMISTTLVVTQPIAIQSNSQQLVVNIIVLSTIFDAYVFVYVLCFFGLFFMSNIFVGCRKMMCNE